MTTDEPVNRSTHASLYITGGVDTPAETTEIIGLSPTWYAEIGHPAPMSVIKQLSRGLHNGPASKANVWSLSTAPSAAPPEAHLKELQELFSGKEHLLAGAASRAEVMIQLVLDYAVDRLDDEGFVHDVVTLDQGSLAWLSRINATIEIYFSE